MSKNLYLAIEGMDGSGKSTLARAVVDQIPWSEAPRLFAFPSHDGEVGKLIRRTFSGEAQLGGGNDRRRDQVLGFLMVADGLDREVEVKKTLDAGVSVVCDRHPTVSGWVYQTECMSIDMLLAIQQRQLFLRPTVCIVDVPAEVAIERMKTRGVARNKIFEKDGIDYVNRLRAKYHAYATMNSNAFVLDGTQPTEQLVGTIRDSLKEQGLLQ